MHNISSELKEKILKIRVVIFDVDGVLTDGRIVLGNYGDELKFFDVKDGLGMARLRQAGLKTIMMTARKSRINQKRADEVKIVKLFQNVDDKFKCFEKILRKFKVERQEVCYMGDDLIDIPVLESVGFSVAPADAVMQVKERVHYVTIQKGGRGAVRELSDIILKTQDKQAL